jgi:hypothetical protein
MSESGSTNNGRTPEQSKPTTASAFRTITEDEFIEQFKPEQCEDGSYYRQRDWTDPDDLIVIEQAAKEGRCWTALNTDGGWGLSSGMHWVNRVFYIICAMPVPAGEQIDVLDDMADPIPAPE